MENSTYLFFVNELLNILFKVNFLLKKHQLYNGRVRPLSMATLKTGTIGPFFSVYLSVKHYDQGLYTGE